MIFDFLSSPEKTRILGRGGEESARGVPAFWEGKKGREETHSISPFNRKTFILMCLEPLWFPIPSERGTTSCCCWKVQLLDPDKFHKNICPKVPSVSVMEQTTKIHRPVTRDSPYYCHVQ